MHQHKQPTDDEEETSGDKIVGLIIVLFFIGTLLAGVIYVWSQWLQCSGCF